MTMSHQAINLDTETEQVLQAVTLQTGLTPAEALKQGLILLQQHWNKQTDISTAQSFEIYQQLDLGEGGYATVSSAQVKEGIKTILQKKI